MAKFGHHAWVCLLLACAAAGCTGTGGAAGFRFDDRGWGGPKLQYTFDPATGTFCIQNGMMVNEKFRWADGRLSLAFLDTRDLVWGFRLMDLTFREKRWEAVRKGEYKVGTWVKGSKLPADEMWKFDTVCDVQFAPDPAGRTYKVIEAVGYDQIQDDGQRVLQTTTVDAAVNRGAWNTLSVSVAAGKVTYAINGGRENSLFRIDPRTNGQFGLFVGGNGPLYVRDLKFDK